jgi:hypothetical protein
MSNGSEAYLARIKRQATVARLMGQIAACRNVAALFEADGDVQTADAVRSKARSLGYELQKVLGAAS